MRQLHVPPHTSTRTVALTIARAIFVSLVALLVFASVMPVPRAQAQGSCNGAVPTIDMTTNGGNGQGTPGADVILGTSGDDLIDGLGGDDLICGATGDDTIDGGDGNDTVFGQGGRDIIIGGSGNDSLFGGGDRDIIRGNSGQDIIEGNDGDDRLLGGIDGDTIDGGPGDDYLGGFGGPDILNGGPGDETIFGGFGADTINGGDGNDTISGLIGDDTISGGPGNDLLNGDRGTDTIDGNSGNDVVNGGGAADTINGNDGNDQLNGGKADDTIKGGPGDDVIRGNLGNDRCEGGPGTNKITSCEDSTPVGQLTLVALAGNNQRDVATMPVRDPLVVQVRDDNGVALAGVDVTFVPVSGSVDMSTVTSNAAGQARVRWTLGATPGPQQLIAEIASNPAVNVSFSATADAFDSACARPNSNGFQSMLANDLFEMASDAYDDDPSIDSCWDLVGTIDITFGGTQAFVARNTSTHDLVVAFRGTEFLSDPQDIYSDANAFKVPWTLSDGTTIGDAAHKGFNTAYRSAEVRVDGLLASARRPDVPDARVYFTGHSLGGALATLAALDQVEDLVAVGYDRSDVVMYSFGAPRSMTGNLDNRFAQLVPNAFAVAGGDDPVPNLPPPIGSNPYVHIPNMVLVHEFDDVTRFEQGPGAIHRDCINLAGFSNHGRKAYRRRLNNTVDRNEPSAWLTVIPGDESNEGRMELNWRGVPGHCDWIGIFRGTPSSPGDVLPTKNFIKSREWAWQPNVVTGRFTQWTGYAKGDGLRAGYVNAFGQFVDVSSPYVPTTPSVNITRTFARNLQLHWTVSDPGRNDYVALFNSEPTSASRVGISDMSCVVCWENAVDGWSSSTNSGSQLTVYVDGFGGRDTWWVAYIQEDEFGVRRILSKRRVTF